MLLPIWNTFCRCRSPTRPNTRSFASIMECPAWVSGRERNVSHWDDNSSFVRLSVGWFLMPMAGTGPGKQVWTQMPRILRDFSNKSLLNSNSHHMRNIHLLPSDKGWKWQSLILPRVLTRYLQINECCHEEIPEFEESVFKTVPRTIIIRNKFFHS